MESESGQLKALRGSPYFGKCGQTLVDGAGNHKIRYTPTFHSHTNLLGSDQAAYKRKEALDVSDISRRKPSHIRSSHDGYKIHKGDFKAMANLTPAGIDIRRKREYGAKEEKELLMNYNYDKYYSDVKASPQRTSAYVTEAIQTSDNPLEDEQKLQEKAQIVDATENQASADLQQGISSNVAADTLNVASVPQDEGVLNTGSHEVSKGIASMNDPNTADLAQVRTKNAELDGYQDEFARAATEHELASPEYSSEKRLLSQEERRQTPLQDQFRTVDYGSEVRRRRNFHYSGKNEFNASGAGAGAGAGSGSRGGSASRGYGADPVNGYGYSATLPSNHNFAIQGQNQEDRAGVDSRSRYRESLDSRSRYRESIESRGIRKQNEGILRKSGLQNIQGYGNTYSRDGRGMSGAAPEDEAQRNLLGLKTSTSQHVRPDIPRGNTQLRAGKKKFLGLQNLTNNIFVPQAGTELRTGASANGSYGSYTKDATYSPQRMGPYYPKKKVDLYQVMPTGVKPSSRSFAEGDALSSPYRYPTVDNTAGVGDLQPSHTTSGIRAEEMPHKYESYFKNNVAYRYDGLKQMSILDPSNFSFL